MPLDEPVETEEGTLGCEVAAGEAGPKQLFMDDEFRNQLEGAIIQLAEKYREPLVLRHAAEMSYDEIAEALELPLGTVKTRLFRVREALRTGLSDLLEPLASTEA